MLPASRGSRILSLPPVDLVRCLNNYLPSNYRYNTKVLT
jgi:hypothetical protein